MEGSKKAVSVVEGGKEFKRRGGASFHRHMIDNYSPGSSPAECIAFLAWV